MIHRRRFMQQMLLAGGAVMVGSGASAEQKVSGSALFADAPFNLDYAFHDGMFAHHGGKEFTDQIRFAHERGFRSIEDNGMRGRDKAQQEKIGQLLAEKNMRMGVFVAHTIDWVKPSITGTDKTKHEQFLKEIADSVEVAK